MDRRPTSAFIDTGALKHNYLEIKRKLPVSAGMMAVVKANAYGHGDIEAARVFESLGCEFFGVAIPEEGAKLRQNGIITPIVVLGGVFPDQIKALFEFDLTPVVFDVNIAGKLDRSARDSGRVKNIHLKIDTGMGRLGLMSEDLPGFLDELTGFKNLRVEAVLSHFAESESEDQDFSKDQLKVFLKALDMIKARGIYPAYADMANSAAIAGLPESHLNLARPGIMLYGSYPAERLRKSISLMPAMEIRTKVLSLKSVPAGYPVSYGRTFVTKRPSLIAALPIGYADGLPRRLSGKGSVLINGRRAPLAGRVCMDLTMCDVTGIPVKAGDEAVILGARGDERITAEEIAEQAGTISYEIFCNISGRVPRVYI